MTTKEYVAANLDSLRQMTCAELTKVGQEHFNSRAGFSAYKRALKEVAGIDYNQLRAERRQERKDAISEAASKSLTLVTDATAERFAICNEQGEPLWYGRFFDGEGGEQSAAELEAAKKAIWLAMKVKEALGEQALNLHLLTDAQWLCWGEFSADSKRGGKARVLGEMAMKYKINLTIEHISGSSNPADYYSRTRGYKKWQENNLTDLVA